MVPSVSRRFQAAPDSSHEALLGQEVLLAPAPFDSHGVSQTQPQSDSLWVPALTSPLYCVVLKGVKAILPWVLSSPSPIPFTQPLTRSGGAGASPAWLHASLELADNAFPGAGMNLFGWC